MEGKPLSDFEMIVDSTPEQVLAVVKRDKWFEQNEAKGDRPMRFIKYVTEGNKIVSIDRKNNKLNDDYHEVNPIFDTKKLIDVNTPLSEDDLIAVLFSYNGNKGPLLEFKKFVSNKGSASNDLEMKFLAHAAWFHGNGGYGADKDPLYQEEKKINPSFTLPSLSEGNHVFETVAFKNFSEAVKKATEEDNKEILSGLDMDLDRAKNFLSAITGVTTGGRKTLKKSRKTTKKSRKTIKKSRKSHKKSRKSRK